MQLEPHHLIHIIHRIHYISGQLKACEKMLGNKRSAADILNLLLAIEGGIQKLIYDHFEDALRKHLALLILSLQKHPHLDPESQEKITFILSKFPAYKLRQLPKVIRQLEQIQKKIAT